MKEERHRRDPHKGKWEMDAATREGTCEIHMAGANGKTVGLHCRMRCCSCDCPVFRA